MQATDLLLRAVRAAGFGQQQRRAISADRIADGRVVSLHYTLRLDDTSVVDAYRGSPPFLYLHGAGNVVRGLEQAIYGHRIGDRIRVSVPPELGYGPLRADMFKRVARSEFPDGVTLSRGMRFRSVLGDGTLLPAWIAEVGERELVVSFNHPLAGETLHFAVEVVGVRRARLGELSHGHPHGPGGIEHRR